VSVVTRLLVAALLVNAQPQMPDPGAAFFDHTLLDQLLRKHVALGRVDYDAFRAAAAFKRYLASLAAFDPAGLPESERLAYWINAYNAYTIALINAHGERESIRNIRDAWRQEIVVAGGERYSLDQVEHEVIRKGFRDPRVHFALVCAAVSCPPLRSEAYDGTRLDVQLDDQARTFLLRSPEKNRVDASLGTVHGSPIWASWYKADFGGDDAAVGAYLSRFFPPGPERELLARGRFRLVESSYDWGLNGR
jgi:hypothetical protein